MKVIVAGSRNFHDSNFIYKKLDFLFSKISSIEIVEGGCRGVDLIAKQYAKDRSLPYKEFPANWEVYGKKAGPIRNEQMALYADGLVAFYDGKSAGTGNMIQTAQKAKLKIKIVDINKNSQ